MRDYIVIYAKPNVVCSSGVVTGNMIGWLTYTSCHSKQAVLEHWVQKYGEQLVDVILVNESDAPRSTRGNK